MDLRRSLALGLAGLAAAGIVVLLRATAGRAPLGRSELMALEPVAESAPARLASPIAAAPVEVQQEPKQEPPEEARRAAERQPVSRDPLLVAGRVELPPGFCAGEEVLIVAYPGPGRRRTTTMAGNGRFDLRVPHGTKEVSIGLESRFLWLRELVHARPGDQIVLAPDVGGVIEGVVLPPTSLSTLGAAWKDMQVRWSLGACREGQWSPPVVPDHDGVFELEHVAAGAALEIFAENPFGPTFRTELAPLAPGEVRKVEIALELGGVVTGKVIDERGEPVAGVFLALGAMKPPSWDLLPARKPRTDSAGRFVLSKVSRAETLVRTDDHELLRQGDAAIDLRSGEVRDIVLRCVRGGTIEGRVRWPDRSLVEHFEVLILEPYRGIVQGHSGHFRASGMPAGRYRLEARASRDGFSGSIEALEVETDGEPLELVLAEDRTSALRGAVVDGSGVPVEEFQVYAFQPDRPLSRSPTGSAGRFELDGLVPGTWNVRVHSPGRQSVKRSVEVPLQSSDELRFELLAAGRVLGRVVDEQNDPVAGAWVGEESVAAIGGPMGSDAHGEFELELDSTHCRLVARANGHAPSEVIELWVRPGETVGGVVLRLRASCRAEGRVLDERGNPVHGARIRWSSGELLLFGVQTSADGRFMLDDLPPGPGEVGAWCKEKPGLRASCPVTLAPGSPASIELRFESRAPVR